jgi:hypothetical protein
MGHRPQTVSRVYIRKYGESRVPKALKPCLFLVTAMVLGALALHWEITPVQRDGESVVYAVTPVMGLAAITTAWWSASKLASVESKPLSTTIGLIGLVFGLVPYVLLLGVAGFVFNGGFRRAA